MHSPLRIAKADATRILTPSGIQVPNVSRGSRQTVDMSYYKCLLKQQIRETRDEIVTMKNERDELIEFLTEEDALKQDLCEQETLISDLKDQLYDLNVAVDKLCMKEKERGFEAVKSLTQNRQLVEKRCLAILNLKNSLAESNKEQSSLLAEKTEQLDQFLNGMNANDRAEVKQMLKSHMETREELKASREAVSEAEEVLNSLKREMSGNQNISRYLILRTDLKRIQNNNRGSQEDLELFAKPITEQKLIIAQNITEANSRSNILESKVKEMVANLASLKASRAEMISSRRESSDKYKIIQAKSEEIDTLIRKLSTERENLERNIAEFQSNIERVTEIIHINKKTEAANAERVLFESDLDASKYTNSQLEIELRKRRKELEELDTAEATCVNEISNLRAEIAALQAKLAELLDIEKTRESKTYELHDLERSCERSEEQVASLSKQLDEEKTLLASKNTLLSQNGVHAKLAIVDEKLNLVNHEISELKQKMDSHLFTSEKRNLSEMIEKVQQLLMKQQREFM